MRRGNIFVFFARTTRYEEFAQKISKYFQTTRRKHDEKGEGEGISTMRMEGLPDRRGEIPSP